MTVEFSLLSPADAVRTAAQDHRQSELTNGLLNPGLEALHAFGQPDLQGGGGADPITDAKFVHGFGLVFNFDRGLDMPIPPYIVRHTQQLFVLFSKKEYDFYRQLADTLPFRLSVFPLCVPLPSAADSACG